MSREMQWIAACVRGLVQAPPSSIDWDQTAAIAERESVAPALSFALKAGALAAMPPAVRDRLSRQLRDNTARQLILTRELGRLLKAFDGERIPVIPLKGPALAEALYSNPALRPCTDLDLLIRRDALEMVDGLLQRLGYRRMADEHSWDFDIAYDRATLYEGAGGVRVDLHWSLLSDPRFPWNDTAGVTVWERGVKMPFGGGAALGLCREDLLVYLAMHLAVHHGLAGLLWYWDLAQLLEQWGGTLDWETIVERATRWRVRTAMYFALDGCQRWFGVCAPPAVISRLRPRGPRAALLRWLVLHCEAERLKRLEHVIALLLVDRARDLIRPLTHGVLPSPAWIRARYRTSTTTLGGYLAHWRRLAAIARAASRAARGRASR